MMTRPFLVLHIALAALLFSAHASMAQTAVPDLPKDPKKLQQMLEQIRVDIQILQADLERADTQLAMNELSGKLLDKWEENYLVTMAWAKLELPKNHMAALTKRSEAIRPKPTTVGGTMAPLVTNMNEVEALETKMDLLEEVFPASKKIPE